MQITVESTSKIVEINGVPCRVWEGRTAAGIKCHCYIPRIACDKDEPRTEEFERDLKETRPPSAGVAAIPMRMIL